MFINTEKMPMTTSKKNEYAKIKRIDATLENCRKIETEYARRVNDKREKESANNE